MAGIEIATGELMINKETITQLNVLHTRIHELEDMLFEHGAMNKAPCFVCGYNGASYYDSRIHPCAARHFLLWKYI